MPIDQVRLTVKIGTTFGDASVLAFLSHSAHACAAGIPKPVSRIEHSPVSPESWGELGHGSNSGNRAVRIGFSASAHDIIASASEPAPVIGRGWLFAGTRIHTGCEIVQAGQAVLGRRFDLHDATTHGSIARIDLTPAP